MADFMQEHESPHDHELVLDEDLLQDGEPVPREAQVRAPVRVRGAEELAKRRQPIRAGDLLVGKYCVERVHPRGVTGVTVDAEHLQLGQRVAVKLSLVDARAYPDSAARFLRSARLAAQLRNEHVARVVDLGTLDSGTPYSVTEHLSGSDLRGVLRVREWLPFSEAVDYVVQVCEGLAEAHVLGFLHRNLKLSNIFLAREYSERPTIKVLDFSLVEGSLADAALTLSATGSAVSSLAYLAPEQIRDPSSVDLRADIWALGAVLHELITGVPVYSASSALGLFAAIAADPPTPASHLRADIPAELEAVILRCLEKDRECRWPEVGTFVRQLRPFASAQGKEAIERTILVLERRVRSTRSSTPPALPGTSRAMSHVPAPTAVPAVPVLRRRIFELSVAVLGIVGCSIGIGAFVTIHNLRAVLAARPVERAVVASLSPALTAPQPLEARSPAPASFETATLKGATSRPAGTIQVAPLTIKLPRPTAPRVEATRPSPTPYDEPAEPAAAIEAKAPARHALFDDAN